MTTSTKTRTAIVTGAARGIGARRRAAPCCRLVRRCRPRPHEAACKAVMAEIESLGGRSLAVGLDVADEEAVQVAVERVAAELGEPTVLVRTAIIRVNLLFKMTASDWDGVMNVHLRGSFLVTRAVQRYMTEAGGVGS